MPAIKVLPLSVICVLDRDGWEDGELKALGYGSFERHDDPLDVWNVPHKVHVLEFCGLRKVERRWQTRHAANYR